MTIRPGRIFRLSLGLVPLVGGIVAVLLSGHDASRAPVADGLRTGQPDSERIFVVLPGDGGNHGIPVACGDSLVSYRTATRQPPEEYTLRQSLNALFNTPARPATPAGTYNAFGRSSLRIQAIALNGDIVRIALSGVLRLPAKCDGVRARAQLIATINQFYPLASFHITVNGHHLDELNRPVSPP